MPEQMDELALKTLISAEKSDALAAYTAANLSEDRARAMDYYQGDMSSDMPAPEGRSATVSTDVADTIEGLLPQLMDIFCGSDEVVRFEPVGPEDEEAAQQETDYVNHVFMQQNPGFMILYSFLKDGLLSKVGICKVGWEETEQEEDETYYDITEDQYALLSQGILESDGKLEIIEQTKNENGTYDCKVRSTKKLAQAKAWPVPPEEFGIEKGARTIKDCNYCFHDVVTKTETQLVVEGFDEDQIRDLDDYTGNTNIESLERDTVGEHFVTGASAVNKAARLVKITEHYIRMDYEGTGRARLYQVISSGDQGQVLKRNKKLCVEPIDIIPFAATTPVPITHRFFGRSVADLVMPAQREKTAIKRGGLDNLYLHSNPRVEVVESLASSNTLDDLLVSRPGGVVRTKNPGGLNWQVVPDITGSIFPMLGYIDAELEARTGLSKQSQGIDANALQNQSATAVAQVFSASQLRVKLIARIMAEGVRDIFSLLHATIQKHGQEPQTVRLRNSWVPVDPRQWKTRSDMTINVGLGTGGKAQQFAQIMALANFQKELLVGGKANLVDDKALYNTGAELIKIMGHKNPDKFLNDPSAKNPQTGQLLHPPVPTPEDPKLTQIKLQAQTDQLAAQQKADIEKLQAQADIATQNSKTQAEIALADKKADLEAQLAILDHQMKVREHELKVMELNHKMAAQQQIHEHKVTESEMDMVATAHSHDTKMQQGAEAHDQKMAQNEAKPNGGGK